MLLKGAEKIPQIVIAAFQTDFCHGPGGVIKQLHSLLDTVFIDIFHGRASDGSFKKAAEILFVQIDLPCKVRNIDFILIIVLDIRERGLNTLHTPVKISFRREKKPMGRERGKNIHQAGLDIQLACQIISHQTAVWHMRAPPVPQKISQFSVQKRA